MLRLSQCCGFIASVSIALSCETQYKGDHIPGFAGLESRFQAPPGLYVGDVVWVYPTSSRRRSRRRDK
jgi:hypothetical protein